MGVMRFTFGKLETLFAFLATIFGILIIYLTPPMCSPDEGTHFIHSYCVSSGQFFPEVENGVMGRWLPEHINNFIIDNNSARLDRQYDQKYSYKNMIENRKYIKQSEEKVFVGINTATGVSLISYLISSSGILLLKIFGGELASAYNLLIIGKLVNLLFYIIVIYFALKITPYCQNIMFMIALMPMSIFLGASLNYDSILIASSLYYFAILTKILYSEESYCVTTKDILSVCFVTFWLVGIKQMYAPLLILLLLVPIKKFKDKKQYFIAIGSVILTGIIAYLPTIIVNIKLSGITGWNAQAELEQKQYILNDMLNFLVIILRTFKVNLSSYVHSFVGCLGNLDTPFLMPVILVFLVILFSISIFDISKVKGITIKTRIWTTLIIIFIVFASCYVMYIGWTSIPEIGGIAYPIISGLQGRYFIPLFIFGVMIFSNNLLLKIKLFKNSMILWETKVDYLVKMTIIVINILTILLLLLRFYI